MFYTMDMTLLVDFDDPPAGADALADVLEVARDMSRLAAEQLVRVERVRREALTDGARYGATTHIAERSVRLELAAALRITEHAADAMFTRADALVNTFPAMLASLASARVTERHAQVFVDAMSGVEPEFHDRIVPRAVALAEAEPVGVFRRALRKLIDTVRVQTLPERHAQALQDRRVLTEAGDDGMAWLLVYGPMVEVRAAHTRITAMAKAIASLDEETRTLDQIRADVIGDLLIQGSTDTMPDAARGITATVTVTVPALTLLGADGAEKAGPAVVEGVGPIPTDVARELCGGSDGWMRVLTHPETGVVLSVGRDRYRPPAALRRLIRWRAERCMAPGCGMPAARCDIDHNIDWALGGSTSIINLAPFCEGHHTVKHHGGWTVTQIPGSGGALLWRSPSGRTYRVDPERPLVTFAPTGAPSGGPPDPPPF